MGERLFARQKSLLRVVSRRCSWRIVESNLDKHPSLGRMIRLVVNGHGYDDGGPFHPRQIQNPSRDSDRLDGGLSNSTMWKLGSRTSFLNLIAAGCMKCFILTHQWSATGEGCAKTRHDSHKHASSPPPDALRRPQMALRKLENATCDGETRLDVRSRVPCEVGGHV